MTAKDKAKELVDKFRNEFKWVEKDYPINLYRDARQCALIAVDEIISAIKEFHNGAEWQLMESMAWTYWHKVKEEIYKL